LHHTTYSPLIGTTVKLSVQCAPWRSETKASARVVAEIRRLSNVFNLFEPSSEITKLISVGTTDSPELLELIAVAEEWRVNCQGRFDPKIGTSALDLNAIAKGWIIDHAAVCAGPARSLLIDAGGDILHCGAGSVAVGIENPHRPYDNEPPISVVALANKAVATSGSSHRVDHLVDPRTGDVPTAVTSASVVASNAATADVVATILAVGHVQEGLSFGNRLGLAVALVDAQGELHRNKQWRSIEVRSR
jgi:thiamine biosynthesis lipoprotein